MCEVTRKFFDLGKEYGEGIGREQGREQGIRAIVERMAKRGKSLKEIAEDTGQAIDVIRLWLSETVPIGQ